MPVFKQSYNYHLFAPSKWLDRREELSEVTLTVDFVTALAKCACQGTRNKSALILSSFTNSQVFFLSAAKYISDLTEFYRKKNISFKLEHPTAIHQHFKGGSECVLAIMLPNSNNKFWFFTVCPQFFYSAIPSCRVPLIPGFRICCVREKKKNKTNKPNPSLHKSNNNKKNANQK